MRESAVLTVLLQYQLVATGYSLVDIKPMPHFKDGRTDSYIGKEVS